MQNSDLLSSYLSLCNKTKHLEDIKNQLKQRDSVQEFDLQESYFGSLPQFRSGLLAKIDMEITRLLELVSEDLVELEKISEKFQASYFMFGNMLQTRELSNQTFCSGVSDTFIGDFMAKFDQIARFLKENVAAKQIYLQTLDWDQPKYLEDMCRTWKFPYHFETLVDEFLAKQNVINKMQLL